MRPTLLLAAALLALSSPHHVLAQPLRLALLGQALIEADPRGPGRSPSRTIRPLLDAADGVFTNLEASVKDTGCVCTPTRTDVFQHAATPDVLDYLKTLHVSVLSLANNHAWDFGAEGVLSTLHAATARGFTVAGTGPTIGAATAPAYRTIKGHRVALVAVATVRLAPDAAATDTRAGVNLMPMEQPADWDRNIAALGDARKHAEIVIAYHHCQTLCTDAWQQRWAHAAIDAGATLYIAHGEPTLRGIEVYHGRPILYGLGNYIFQTKTEGGHYPPDVWESVVADVVIGSAGAASFTFTPIVLDGEAGAVAGTPRGIPEVATSARGATILSRLATLSAATGTTIEVRGGKGYLVIPPSK